MHHEVIALTFDVSTGEGREPPKQLRIFPKGRFSTTKGDFLFDDESAASVMAAAAEWGNDFSFDYEHRALHAAESGTGEAPAAGWFSPAVKDGELWADNLRWTSKAKQYLSGGEYRYFSPAFLVDEDGRVTRLLNVALTNLPATNRMQALVAASTAATPTSERSMAEKTAGAVSKEFHVALGLPEAAQDSEALSAISALRGQVASIQALTGKATAAEALGAISAWRADAERVAALNVRVQELEQAQQSSEVDALVKRALEQKKASPAQEAWLRQLGKQNVAMLRSFIETATPVVGGGGGTAAREPTPGTSAVSLTQEAIAVARQLGKDPKELEAAFRARAAST